MSERIRWLDGWRGLVCALMVGYHFLFDLTMFGYVPVSFMERWPLVLTQWFVAMSFIFLAGVSSHFTRSNLRRGLITLGAGALVVAASYVADAPIRYGMLEFLGCAMLVYHFLGKYADRVPDGLAPWLWAALYFAARAVSANVFVQGRWLYWLGLRYRGFVSYDWEPFFPNIFLFLLGAWFGKRLTAAPTDSRLRTLGAPKWLAWVGRHTLWIYMLHQPVLYGACWAVHATLG